MQSSLREGFPALIENLTQKMIENMIDTVRLLVVSRDPAVVRGLAPLEASGVWQLETAANGWEAMERMQLGAASHLLVLDIALRDGEPMHFLHWLTSFRPDVPVVLLCCPDDAGRVEDASGLGAEDMVMKPFELNQLEKVIRQHLDEAGAGALRMGALSTGALSTGALSTGPAGAGADPASRNIERLGPETCFVSASLVMQKLRVQAALLAKTDVPVLILGERGAGKYTAASLIHKLSVRSGFKLLRLNCAAMPEAVLAAELFGDEPDSPVNGSRPVGLGKFAAGEKGTILLEEVGEMPSAVQFRLLQVLQNQELRSPGGSAAPPVEVRILATSSANLERVLAEKRLREDLYHRLSAFTLQVPPLRQRKDEIATLLRYFMHNLARHYGLPARGFSLSLLAACQRYSWPGNLTELETFVKRYLVAGDRELMLSEIGVDAKGRAEQILVSLAVSAEENRNGEEKREREIAPKAESLKSLVQGVKFEAERNAIGAALARTGWNRKAAARLLKVSYRTLLYKIEQYQMRAPQSYLSPFPAGGFSGFDEVKGNGKAS